MIKPYLVSGTDVPRKGWCWGFFAAGQPMSVDHKVLLFASDGSTQVANWTFPAGTPAKLMFTNPIKLEDNIFYASNTTDSVSFNYYILLSASPNEMGIC